MKIYFLERFIPRLFFIICCCITIPGFAQAKYDLFDPRNPDCPCHQYQKLADDEFAQLDRNKSAGAGDSLANNNIIVSDAVTHTEIKTPVSYAGTSHRKIHKSRKNKSRWIFVFRSCGIKKIRPDYKNCFRW